MLLIYGYSKLWYPSNALCTYLRGFADLHGLERWRVLSKWRCACFFSCGMSFHAARVVSYSTLTPQLHNPFCTCRIVQHNVPWSGGDLGAPLY